MSARTTGHYQRKHVCSLCLLGAGCTCFSLDSPHTSLSITNFVVRAKLSFTISLPVVAAYLQKWVPDSEIHQKKFKTLRNEFYGQQKIKGRGRRSAAAATDMTLHSAFDNCLNQTHYVGTSKFGVKYFRTGTIHVTAGTDSVAQVKAVIRQAMYWVVDAHGPVSILDATVGLVRRAVTPDVQIPRASPLIVDMINANVRYAREVKLRALQRFISTTRHLAIFNPAEYPALNVQYVVEPEAEAQVGAVSGASIDVMSESPLMDASDPSARSLGPAFNPGATLVSVLVFNSGSVIITGAKDIAHLLAAYTWINSIIPEFFSDLKPSA